MKNMLFTLINCDSNPKEKWHVFTFCFHWNWNHSSDPFCLKEYFSADNRASVWYFNSFLHTSKWLFSGKFSLSEWGRNTTPWGRKWVPTICSWNTKYCGHMPMIAQYSQLSTAPWYKGRLPFFVEGKTTISCSFLSSFSYCILKQYYY